MLTHTQTHTCMRVRARTRATACTQEPAMFHLARGALAIFLLSELRVLFSRRFLSFFATPIVFVCFLERRVRKMKLRKGEDNRTN